MASFSENNYNVLATEISRRRDVSDHCVAKVGVFLFFLVMYIFNICDGLAFNGIQIRARSYQRSLVTILHTSTYQCQARIVILS